MWKQLTLKMEFLHFCFKFKEDINHTVISSSCFVLFNVISILCMFNFFDILPLYLDNQVACKGLESPEEFVWLGNMLCINYLFV